MIEEFCRCRDEIAIELGIKDKTALPEDFVKIGKQIFVNESLSKGMFLNSAAYYRLANWSTKIILGKWFKRNNTDISLSAHDLMQCALSLRTFAELNESLASSLSKLFRKRLLNSRNQCRELLVSKLAKKSLTPYVEPSPRLKGPLRKDSTLLQWRSIACEHGDGQIVVAGDFDTGPFLFWNNDIRFLDEKAVLVCEELYPEIFKYFSQLKAIICQGGALTSHLAILAREAKMPLWIQVPDARNRFI